MKTTLLFLVLSAAVFGQSFVFTTPQTTINASPGTEIIFPFFLKNISSDTITLDFVRNQFSVPNEWTCNLCFDVSCFAAFIDSVSTTEDFNSSPLAPNETRDVSVHFFTNMIPGTGSCTIYMKNRRNPADKITLTLQASTLGSKVDDEPTFADFRISSVFPQPASINKTVAVQAYQLNAGEISVEVFSEIGQTIYSTLAYHPGKGFSTIQIPFTGAAQGVYFIRFGSEGKMITKKVVLSAAAQQIQ